MIPNAFNLEVEAYNCISKPTDLGSTHYKIISKTKVLAIETSISASEFYHSKLTDIKVSRVIKLNYYAYNKEKFIRIDDVIFKVIRTFFSGTFIELSLEETNLKENDGWLA